MKISIKQKSYIFVLILVSILLLILNYVISISHQGYLKQMQSTYSQTFDSFYANYISNLNSFYTALSYEAVTDELISEISSINTPALLQRANKIFSNIKSNEIFLNSVSIILKDSAIKVNKASISMVDKKDIEMLAKKIKFNHRTYVTLSDNKEEVHYSITAGIYDGSKLIGFFEYNINPLKLISAIKEFDGTFSMILTKFDLEIYSSMDFNEHKELFIKTQQIGTENIIKTDSSVFFIKRITLQNDNQNDMLEFILLHDISQDSRAYHATIRNSIYISIVLFILTAFVVNFIFRYLIAKLENSEQKLKLLNENLKQQVELESSAKFEILKKSMLEAKQKEQMLMHQSRLATMGEMIASIAHQWRQPLTGLGAIFMYFEAYYEKMGLNDEKYEKKIQTGGELLKFMSNTIDDFRNFYKVDREKELFSLKDAVDSSIVILSGSLNKHNIKLSYDIAPDIQVLGYKNEFSHVIVNLISNARDAFLARGLHQLDISIKARINEDLTIITISDNAGGIDENLLSKIFEPYFSTKNYKYGTGMGLYISKMIIENNMNGTIKAYNSADGACFEISVTKKEG